MRPEALPCAGKAGATAFSVDGAGEEAVVLIHGVGMARRVWAPQIEALARRHTVLSYDMLGHGDSDLPAADVTLAWYADQLRELLDALGLARAHVVGHSMGALVALEFALNHPERTRRVVAMNAVFQRSPEQRAAVMARAQALHDTDLSDSVGPTIERWFGRPVPAALARPAAEVEALLPLRVLAHIHLTQLQEIAGKGDRILHERVLLTPLRKWWIGQRVRWGWLR